MNYYPFHLGDYASATRHLSWDEDMAYRRLIDAYYTKEEPIPLDRRQVYRLVCATTQEQRDAVDVVLHEFFEETPEGWRNGRCDAELAAFHAKSAKASQSAHARWRNANGQRPQSEGNANASAEACERIQEGCDGNATKTKTNTNSSIPNGIEGKPGKRAAIDKPEGITQEVWDGFLAIRKAKKAPLTAAALEGIKREATKAGIDLQEALQVCCTRGWQGFNAEWIGGSTQAAAGKAPARTSRHSGFEKINYREGINADGTFA